MRASTARLVLFVGVAMSPVVSGIAVSRVGAAALTAGAAAPSAKTSTATATSVSPSAPVSWATQASLPVRPIATTMAFDNALGKMVLFATMNGQHGRCPCSTETWTYANGAWAQQFPAASPPVQSGLAMAYDPLIGKLVLIGVRGSGPVATWTYDGTTWRHESPATSPPPRTGAALAFDDASGRLVLFGGYDTPSDSFLSETWSYDGTIWTHDSTATSPSARADAGMAFDAAIGKLVLFGGMNYDGQACGAPLNDTWTYDGSAWQREAPTANPPAAESPLVAYDAATREIVMFRGLDDRDVGSCPLTVSAGTWVFNAETWTQRFPTVSPSKRVGAVVAYDPPSRNVLLLGGTDLRSGRDRGVLWSYEVVGSGYRIVSADGGVYAFDAPFAGSTGTMPASEPIVGIASSPNRRGYWLAGKTGAVNAFGAPSLGIGDKGPNDPPMVGITAAPNGRGYWVADQAGDVYGFGNGAPFLGAPATFHPNHAIVGLSAAPSGDGYLAVASDGGIFAFGTPFYGSTGGLHLNQPIVGMAADPATGGYWLVAADGGIFAFNAPFFGSTGAMHLNQPIVGMTPAPDGNGYWLVARDGGVFSFGPGAAFHGSTGGMHLNAPIVAIAGQ